MQPNTGHLVDINKLSEGKTKEEIEKLQEELAKIGYEEVPESHVAAAKRKLAGKSEAHISLTSGGKLSKWAAQKRKEKKQRHKDKLGSKEYNRRRGARRIRSAVEEAS